MQREFHKTHLAVLRACNELLRRLSRAEDAVFCGRVFFFLFQSFPLGDKSSVNLRGEFHIDNVTTFEKELEPLPVATESAEKMDVEPPIDGPASDAQSTSSSLYPIFWRLQQDFSVPTRLFEEAHFTVFKQGLERTMEMFEKTPVVVQTKTVSDDPRGTKRKFGQDDGHDFNSNYNPKYLTSRDLFELELSDLAFQRHILVQALILVDFLLSLTEKAKAKIADANIPKTNQSLLYQYTLNEEDTKWVKATRTNIADYLQKGPDGNFYYRMVNTVLSRDKNWVRWKIESCPSIVSDAVPPGQYLEARATLRKVTAVPRMRAKPVNAIDLTFLSEADNAKGLERLKDRARYVESCNGCCNQLLTWFRFTPPTIKELTKGIENDELDMEMAMTDEEKQFLEAAKDSKTWRALRIASKTCLSKLDLVEPGQKLNSIFEETGAAERAANGNVAVIGDGHTPEVQVAS